jgi:hypothetical protein
MAQSMQKQEQLARTRARILAYTAEDLAQSMADNREFGPGNGYRDGDDWWETQVRSYPSLFKGEDAIERPAWLDEVAAPAVEVDPEMAEAIDFIMTGGPHTHQFLMSVAAQLIGRGTITEKQAAAVLKFKASAMRRAEADAEVAAKPVRELPTEGMYRTEDGTIYKVQVAHHGTGKLYAKKLVQEGDAWRFEYERGAIYRLTASDKMTLEEAKAFGALYGTCCVCGRTLTDEESIAAGIGPVCAGKGEWA